MELPGINNLHISNLLPKDGIFEYSYPFISADHCNELIDSIKWKQDRMNMFGKMVKLPRLTAWYGDEGISYNYSGIQNEPNPWTELLLKLKSSVEQECKTSFNSVLLNYYRSGLDHMSWHSDNERELGSNPLIASLSFGEIRKFQMKHKKDKGLDLVSLNVEPGSLLVMKGPTQEHWNHRISKTSKSIGPRVNLTFRSISL